MKTFFLLLSVVLATVTSVHSAEPVAVPTPAPAPKVIHHTSGPKSGKMKTVFVPYTGPKVIFNAHRSGPTIIFSTIEPKR
jgi:hypothetical protein